MTLKEYLEIFLEDREGRIGLGIITTFLIASLSWMPVTNHLRARKVTKTDNYLMVSKPIGYSGHTTYIEFEDGKKQYMRYPGLGFAKYGLEIATDYDGDGTIDEIIRNSKDHRLNKTKLVLNRKKDFYARPELFKKADKKVYELDQYMNKKIEKGKVRA